MTKSDLKPGMVIECVKVKGSRYLVLDEYKAVSYATYILLKDFKEDLTHTFLSPDYDIVKVYDTTREFTLNSLAKNEDLNLIWERHVYPMWFRHDYGNGAYIIVKFTGLNEGTVIESTFNNQPVGEHSDSLISHTDINIWTQVEEPVTEMTLEEVCQALGKTIKIKKG